MAQLEFPERDARLLFLAALYHLERPGSEVDPETGRPRALGLIPVRQALEAQLEDTRSTATFNLELTEHQLGRLDEALLGLVNELKQVALSGSSVVGGLMAALARTFPGEVTPADPGGALDLAGEAALLRRRLASAIRDAASALEEPRAQRKEAAQIERPWWKRWSG